MPATWSAAAIGLLPIFSTPNNPHGVKRIDFLKSAGLALAGGLTGWTGLKGANFLSDSSETDAPPADERSGKKARGPVMLGTWPFAQTAIGAAWDGLTQSDGTALDAVEAAARRTEADPNERSVGLGGRPDRDGIVTLDACVMDHLGNIGSVAAVENVVHVSSLARAVMEHTPHVMLVGDGARQFAREMGFPLEDLMVPDSKKEWEQWKIKSEYKPIPNIENHDTIGLLALDGAGRLAGLCTTSGMAFKMHGRVGDSPIIGAGLYVDGSVGGATATGHGEEVIRTVGSFRVVAAMTAGKSPQAACKQAVEEIHRFFVRRGVNWGDTQIGFIAVNRRGETGAYALRPGFSYAVRSPEQDELIRVPSLLEA